MKAKLDRGDRFTLIDIREPQELQICRIPGGKLIPPGELPKRLAELDPNSEIVAYCRTGRRSGEAINLLIENGFRNVRNMTGGLHAWSDQVDPSVPKY